MTEILVTSVLEEALKQFSDRIAKKLTEGKRLTDTEVIILLLDQMNKRIDLMNESLNKRIDDLRDSLNRRMDEMIAEMNKRMDERIAEVNSRMDDLRNSLNSRIEDMNRRIDELRGDVKLLYQEVSSIKSDVINLLKERLSKS